MNIYENHASIDQYRSKSRKTTNQWESKKFRIPKKFIRGHNVNINIHKRFPRPAGYKLQAAGHRLQATGNRLQARGIRAARSFRLQARGQRRQATSYRLQATGYKHHVWGWPQDHFGMFAGFQKAVISNCICSRGVVCWIIFQNVG